MLKKLTITVDEDVYRGLHERIGRRRISRFLNDLARPHVGEHVRRRPTDAELDASYAAMAEDEEENAEAFEWCEAMIGDVAEDD